MGLLLKLDEDRPQRDTISIFGTEYELKVMGDLSLRDRHRLFRRMSVINQHAGDGFENLVNVDESEFDDLDATLLSTVKLVLDAPHETLKKLSAVQMERILQLFTEAAQTQAGPTDG